MAFEVKKHKLPSGCKGDGGPDTPSPVSREEEIILLFFRWAIQLGGGYSTIDLHV